MEAIGEIAKRLVERARDQREALARKSGPDNLPGVQSHPEEKDGPMPERDGNDGRGGLELLALRMEGRSK